jgi:hypothetical protein
MGKLSRDAIDQLKEATWAAFLIYFVIIALTALFVRHLGYAAMAYISLSFAVLIALLFRYLFEYLCDLSVPCAEFSDLSKRKISSSTDMTGTCRKGRKITWRSWCDSASPSCASAV